MSCRLQGFAFADCGELQAAKFSSLTLYANTQLSVRLSASCYLLCSRIEAAGSRELLSPKYFFLYDHADARQVVEKGYQNRITDTDQCTQSHIAEVHGKLLLRNVDKTTEEKVVDEIILVFGEAVEFHEIGGQSFSRMFHVPFLKLAARFLFLSVRQIIVFLDGLFVVLKLHADGGRKVFDEVVDSILFLLLVE